MAKEDMTSVDTETRGLVEKGYQPPKSKPASGEKLIDQINREAEARRDGKGR
ncbi:hypothetical protein [Bradyrhizobium sp. McL0615]|uniref:hypothetical protein n=1 Tax=Bradyrhizobium sp. McL0615 TaxID=3415673 RepID=UPI003CF9503C